MSEFPIDQLHHLPYVDTPPSGGRAVTLQMAYFDQATKDWHLYLEVRPGIVGRMAGGETVHGTYLSSGAENPARDLELPLSTLLHQRLSFPRLIGRLTVVENDLHNVAAVLDKFHLISEMSKGTRASLLMITEIEYLLALARGYFDALNDIVRDLAPLLITLGDTQQRVVKSPLPQSFASVALTGDQLVSGDEIVALRGLPTALANWYVREAPALRLLRKIRDAVLHRGKALPHVFDLPDLGLAVDQREDPWREFAIWERYEPVHGNLMPLRAAFAATALVLTGAAANLAAAIEACVTLPPPIGAGVRVFLRNAVSARLVEAPSMLAQPWERQPAAL